MRRRSFNIARKSNITIPVKLPSEIRSEILRLTREYSILVHGAHRPAWGRDGAFVPGASSVPYAGRVFDEEEVAAAVGASLDFWLTLGPEGKAFEDDFAEFLGVKYTLLVNSGSSANLIAISALTSHKIPRDRRIMQGDEVITVAAGFPTTVAPIVQVGAVPVFVDNDPITGNIRIEGLELAYVEGKTKAVMMAHTLGNPFDLGAVLKFCRRHSLWLIEDNCDSLGSTYTMPLEMAHELGVNHLLRIAESSAHPVIKIHRADGTRISGDEMATAKGTGGNLSESGLYITAPTGSWGDLSTQSFYPPHHMTLGEGGAVNIVSLAALKTYAESFRDWGRDCWCASGKDNTCGRRFAWKLGELPDGYDHKYVYSHFGYNLKPLDIQAAIGRKQLVKLPSFVESRRRNWHYLRAGLSDLENWFSFSLPTHASDWRPIDTCPDKCMDGRARGIFDWGHSLTRTNPSWFGFMLIVRDPDRVSVRSLAKFLDQNGIGNRMLFGGNLVKQPLFVQLGRDRPNAFRVSGMLTGADRIMNGALFVGTFPGLSLMQLDYIIACVRRFLQGGRL